MLKIIILFTLIFTSCKKANKLFDEIHLSTYTDSSYIQLFVTNDSIIILQLERGECDAYMGCEYGPKYYAQTSISKQIFKLINEHVQTILSDTFELEGIIITHASKSNLSIFYKDTLVKRFNYYGSESNSSDIVEIKNKLLKLINDSDRINLKISERLIDNSDLVSVDSIRITKLKLVTNEGFKGKYVSHISDYELRMITQKGQIDTIIQSIQNLKILDTTDIKAFNKFIPKYELDFYRNGLICFELETDLVIMPYSWLQVLKVDSFLIKNIINLKNKWLIETNQFGLILKESSKF